MSQINLQHSRDATGELASVLTGKREIILIQEPYFFRNKNRGLEGSGHKLVVGYEEEVRPRTCILASPDVSVIPLPQLGSRDATTAVLEYKVSKGGRKLLICSLYLPYDDARPPILEDLERIIAFARERGLPMLIGCDANAHSEVWGSTNTNARGETLIQFLAHTNLEVLNIGNDATFINRIRKEVIDITLASRSLVDEISDWRVSSDISMSDHRMIKMEIRSDKKAATLKRNPRATDWEKYISVLEGNIGD